VKGHFALNVLIKSINDRRRLVQFAADGEWPFDDAANAPIRREFGLPVNRPFVVVSRGGGASTPLPASAPRKAVTAKKAGKTRKAVKKRKK
jgi:hypothetical protein